MVEGKKNISMLKKIILKFRWTFQTNKKWCIKHLCVDFSIIENHKNIIEIALSFEIC